MSLRFLYFVAILLTKLFYTSYTVNKPTFNNTIFPFRFSFVIKLPFRSLNAKGKGWPSFKILKVCKAASAIVA
jgi:hypothetical protein